ncbi:MAG: hypothetical protein DI630_31060 [Gordonia sp. (in: high G+C Gram-positive bacteria)]|nr:MAG: hypothetical protein DI630_31060 [Gordonia sp. (in: high G+C Gram-positive bacteria)]
MTLAPITQDTQCVTIYLNVARDGFGAPTGMRDGYKAGDELRMAFRLPLTDEESRTPAMKLAEKVYHLLNVGDDPAYGTPDDRAVAYRMALMRSLSVGDVIEINGAYLAVAGMGFAAVDAPKEDAISMPW